MSLVYLDTSNLARLTKVKENDPERFEWFLTRWKRRNYVLALSDSHFFEILRHGDPKERNNRFRIIDRFLPARFENSLTEKEVTLALYLKGVVTNISNPINFFSEKIFSPEALFKYTSLDTPEVRDIHDLIYESFEIIWASRNNPPTEKKPQKLRLSDIPDDAISTINLEEVRGWLKLEIEKNIVNDTQRYSSIPSEFIANGNNYSFTLIDTFFTRCKEIGLKSALAEFIEVDINDRKIQTSELSNLIKNFKFKKIVEHTIRDEFEIEGERDLKYFVSKINLRDCPGTWLKSQVERKLRRSRNLKASNEKDIEHLGHLPYVDFFFADATIAEMCRQVAKTVNLPRKLRDTLPISISDSIESIEKALNL
jgi:hypothetical protein